MGAVDDVLDAVFEAAELGRGQVSLEHAPLDMVQVAAAGAQHPCVPDGGGVVHDDHVHALPPDPEGAVGRAFQQATGQLEGVEVEQFVVRDRSAQGPVLHRRGEFVPDGLDDELAAGVAEHRAGDIGVEMPFLELASGRHAEQQPFGEQWLEDLGEVEGEAVALPFEGAVEGRKPIPLCSGVSLIAVRTRA